MRTEGGEFKSDGLRLYRQSVLPEGEPRARVALVHGYGEHCGRYTPLMEWLAGGGLACYAFDFRGQGRSEGRRGFVTSWEEHGVDLRSFLALPELKADGPPLFVLGHSHGALVLAHAGFEGLPGVTGCIFSAPYFGSRMVVPAFKVLLARLVDPVCPWLRIPSGLRPEWMCRDEELLRENLEDTLLVHTATPRWYLRSRLALQEVMRRAEEFRLPCLMLMGDSDPIADPRAAHDFFLRAGSEDKTYRLYPEHLHELLRERGREKIYSHIREWIEARIDGGSSAR